MTDNEITKRPRELEDIAIDCWIRDYDDTGAHDSEFNMHMKDDAYDLLKQVRAFIPDEL